MVLSACHWLIVFVLNNDDDGHQSLWSHVSVFPTVIRLKGLGLAPNPFITVGGLNLSFISDGASVQREKV